MRMENAWKKVLSVRVSLSALLINPIVALIEPALLLAKSVVQVERNAQQRHLYYALMQIAFLIYLIAQKHYAQHGNHINVQMDNAKQPLENV